MPLQRFLHKNDNVSLFHKGSCINAKGSNANLLAIGIASLS